MICTICKCDIRNNVTIPQFMKETFLGYICLDCDERVNEQAEKKALEWKLPRFTLPQSI